MYKILHWLFGWDYIGWYNSADNGIARVFNDSTGRTFYFRYRITKLIDEIHKPEQVIWLTCKPEKYLKRNFKDLYDEK